ncbi:MAG: hypothetical protein Q9M39_04475 [Sulfurovum sp.]|nr:hypothetical protein [Sulfurovum sp.]
MKKVIIAALVTTLAFINVQAYDKTSVEVCKTYISEAKSFQETMKTNKIDEATFAFYKDQVVANCGSIASKLPYEKSFFALALIEKDKATVTNCKTAIAIAHSYVDNDNSSAFIANAHKINVIDNCGTLVAKKTPAFCLFDVVDNSKESLKDRCLASIEKAHVTMGTKSALQNKNEVLKNCSKLHRSI